MIFLILLLYSLINNEHLMFYALLLHFKAFLSINTLYVLVKTISCITFSHLSHFSAHCKLAAKQKYFKFILLNQKESTETFRSLSFASWRLCSRGACNSDVQKSLTKSVQTCNHKIYQRWRSNTEDQSLWPIQKSRFQNPSHDICRKNFGMENTSHCIDTKVKWGQHFCVADVKKCCNI